MLEPDKVHVGYLKNYIKKLKKLEIKEEKKQDTKGGEFKVKETQHNAIVIPEEWNEEEKMLKQMIHDFLDKELHVLESEPEASKDLPQIVEMLDKAAELGLIGVSLVCVVST